MGGIFYFKYFPIKLSRFKHFRLQQRTIEEEVKHFVSYDVETWMCVRRNVFSDIKDVSAKIKFALL